MAAVGKHNPRRQTKSKFYRLLSAYALANPHLSLTLAAAR